MKNRLSQFVVLLCLLSLLAACGGGGEGSSGVTTQADRSAPTVTAFVIPASSSSLTVPVQSLSATDNLAVTGYLITTGAEPPVAGDPAWSATQPATVTFGASGVQTAYAWARDAAGNVSAGRAATVTITLAGPTAKPVQGAVVDPVTGQSVGGAAVAAFIQQGGAAAKSVASGAVQVVITDGSGNYAISGLTAGTPYYLELSRAGYAPVTYYNVVPDASNSLTLERSRIMPAAVVSQTATVGGRVKNASTNAGLPNMTVVIREGVNNRSGNILATRITDGAGAYSFSPLASGSYTAQVSGTVGSMPIVTSYFTLVSVPGNPSVNVNQDFPVTVGINPSQYRIVLSWGNDPGDLDAHLTGPAASGRFHVYYSAADYPADTTTPGATGYRLAGQGTDVFLDLDSTDHGNDNGPETITILVPRAGTYNYYVQHWEGAQTISAAGAQVKIYKGSALLAVYNPPSGAVGRNDVWAVFSMTVSSDGEALAPLNRILVNTDASTLD